MRSFVTYVGLFAVAIALQFFVFDAIRVSVFFAPLVYVAFVALLPMRMGGLGMLILGLCTGMFVDFFEGTVGAHTAATLMTAYSRRWMMTMTLGRENVDQEVGMPSGVVLGRGKFVRYAALVSVVHCLVFFSLEALSWSNLPLVLVKTFVSGVFTLGGVMACSAMFTSKNYRR